MLIPSTTYTEPVKTRPAPTPRKTAKAAATDMRNGESPHSCCINRRICFIASVCVSKWVSLGRGHLPSVLDSSNSRTRPPDRRRFDVLALLCWSTVRLWIKTPTSSLIHFLPCRRFPAKQDLRSSVPSTTGQTRPTFARERATVWPSSFSAEIPNEEWRGGGGGGA